MLIYQSVLLFSTPESSLISETEAQAIIFSIKLIIAVSCLQ